MSLRVMKIFAPGSWQGLQAPWSHSKCAIIFGSFDGLHLGHRQIVDCLIRSPETPKVLLSFDPHPRTILAPSTQDTAAQNLFTSEERTRIFLGLKIDYLALLPFTKALAAMSATDFVTQILLKRLHVARLIVGYDQRFGHKRQGSFSFLKQLIAERKLPLQVEQVRAKRMHIGKLGWPIIRTRKIRTLIQKGELKPSNALLGFHYFIEARVVHGNAIGRKLDTPTANLDIPSNKIIPSIGVYACRVDIGAHANKEIRQIQTDMRPLQKTIDAKANKEKAGQWIPAVVSIGTRPSVQKCAKNSSHILAQKIVVEVHILDFHENLYGKKILVSFLHCIRIGEKRFSDYQQLKKQIDADITKTRIFFGKALLFK